LLFFVDPPSNFNKVTHPDLPIAKGSLQLLVGVDVTGASFFAVCHTEIEDGLQNVHFL
jgi:hypothetical protein